MLISATDNAAEGVFNQYGAGEFGLYCVIGFFIVIAVLIVLIALLVAFSKILNALSSVKIRKKSEPHTETALPEPVSDDGEIVAAITAALTAYYDVRIAENGEDEMPVPFVIRSIKKNKGE